MRDPCRQADAFQPGWNPVLLLVHGGLDVGAVDAAVHRVGRLHGLLVLTFYSLFHSLDGRLNRLFLFSCGLVSRFFQGLFGGMGGCAMIGQSVINVTSGGRGRLSTFTAGLIASRLLENHE